MKKTLSNLLSAMLIVTIIFSLNYALAKEATNIANETNENSTENATNESNEDN